MPGGFRISSKAPTLAITLVILGVLWGCAPSAEQPTNQPQQGEQEKRSGPKRRDLIIVAVGDINMGRRLGQMLIAGKVDYPFAEVKDTLSNADIAFANLESQISDQRGVTEGSSNYVFVSPPEGADALARAGFDVVSTANNHAWDFGKKAIDDTLSHLHKAGIASAGTGDSLDEAYKAAIVEREGWRVAFLAVTGVFNSPFDESPAKGHVAWADPTIVTLKIKELRSEGVDLIFVSYHGGVEYSTDPTDETRAFARACLDAGADAFIGHHPHVVQGVEWYQNKPIFYSLGNFVFKQFDPWTNRGLGVRLTARDGQEGLAVEYLPVAVDFQPRFLTGAEGQPLLARIESLSGGSLRKSAEEAAD